MKNPIQLFCLMAVSMLVVLSCSKDDDNGPNGDEDIYQAPSRVTREQIIEIPDNLKAKANAHDVGATMAVSSMQLCNSIVQYFSYFSVPQNTGFTENVDDSYTYHWKVQGVEEWVTYKEGSTKYTWTVEYKDASTDKYTVIRAEESKDGKSGSMVVNAPGNIKIWDYVWEIKPDDSRDVVLTSYDESGESAQTKFDISIDADGSGIFKIFEDDVQTWIINWDSSGHGSWTYTPEDDDNMSGTF